jgi:hypothetical protein
MALYPAEVVDRSQACEPGGFDCSLASMKTGWPWYVSLFRQPIDFQSSVFCGWTACSRRIEIVAKPSPLQGRRDQSLQAPQERWNYHDPLKFRVAHGMCPGGRKLSVLAILLLDDHLTLLVRKKIYLVVFGGISVAKDRLDVSRDDNMMGSLVVLPNSEGGRGRTPCKQTSCAWM